MTVTDEAFTTRGASGRFLTRVNSVMHSQVIFASEIFMAYRAFVKFITVQVQFCAFSNLG